VQLLTLCQWLENTPIAFALRESIWMFDIIETIHTLGIVLVAGTIMLVDLRMFGLGLRRETVSEVVSRIVPFTLAGFVLMFVTGSLLFSAEAVRLYASPAFRIKLVLLMLAGLNAFIFHITVYRGAATWNDDAVTPVRARVAASVSLLCWIGIIAAGRAIAYGPGYDQT